MATMVSSGLVEPLIFARTAVEPEAASATGPNDFHEPARPVGWLLTVVTFRFHAVPSHWAMPTPVLRSVNPSRMATSPARWLRPCPGEPGTAPSKEMDLITFEPAGVLA